VYLEGELSAPQVALLARRREDLDLGWEAEELLWQVEREGVLTIGRVQLSAGEASSKRASEDLRDAASGEVGGVQR
jgi:DNA topoisomerase IA